MSHDESTQKKYKSPEEKHLDAVNDHTHHFVSDYDGGKCLWRGVYVYRVHSCSYRYQAIGRAKKDDLVYNWPAYKEAASREKIQTSGRVTKKGGFYPKNYTAEIDAPTEADKKWDLTGQNFQYSTRPYWNQPHHIIPIAAFHKSLQVLADGLAKTRLDEGKQRLISGAEIVSYVRESLLQSEYNINHGINMILLPMDNEVSKILRLPKHGGPSSNNHDQYNEHVKSELDKIMNAYRSYFCDLPDKEHLSDKQRQAQKRRLELLSERLYKLLTRDCPRGKQPGPTGEKTLEGEVSKWKEEMEKAGGPRISVRGLGGGT